MSRRIPLRTANQEFSRLIKDVEKGKEFIITRRGRPVARLVAHSDDKTDDPRWKSGYDRMMKHLKTGASLGGIKIDRDDLYDR